MAITEWNKLRWQLAVKLLLNLVATFLSEQCYAKAVRVLFYFIFLFMYVYNPVELVEPVELRRHLRTVTSAEDGIPVLNST